MAGKNTAVFGIYPSRAAVEEAVEQLRSAGFRSTDISVLFSENQGTKDFAHEKTTKAPEGATTGSRGGRSRRRRAGLAYRHRGAGHPGLGPLIAAGPIVAALAGAGAMGAVGGIDRRAGRNGNPRVRGKALRGPHPGGRSAALGPLRHSRLGQARQGHAAQTGGQDIASAGEKRGDYANADKPMPRVRTASSNVPVVDEELYGEPVITESVTREPIIREPLVRTRKVSDIDET